MSLFRLISLEMDAAYIFMGFNVLLLNLPLSGSVLNIVSIILGGTPVYRYDIAAPTYDVAFEDAQMQFPGLLNTTVRKFVYRLEPTRTCDDEVQLSYDELGNIFQLLSRLEGPTVLQSPGCTQMVTTLGDFSRELDLPLIIGTAGGALFLDKQRFPTVLTFSLTDHGSLRDAAMAMLRMYNWTTITLLCGDMYVKVNVYTIVTCRTLEARLREESHAYEVTKMRYDPAQTDMYRSILQQIKAQSRVIFVFCESDFLKPLLRTALDLDMANGDFIFLSPQGFIFPLQVRKSFGSDLIFQNFSQSLIIYTNEISNWTFRAETSKKISQLARNNYTANFSSDYVNSLNLAAYDGFLSLAEVLNQISQDNQDTSRHDQLQDPLAGVTTAALIARFRNRVFKLKSGDIYLNAAGCRRVNVQFMRLDNVTIKYRTTWKYDILTERISLAPTTDSWSFLAPKNRPQCGFRLDECDQHDQGDRASVIIGPTVLVLMMLLLLIVLFLLILHKGKHSGLWWLGSARWLPLDAGLLVMAQVKEVSAGTCVYLKELTDDEYRYNMIEEHSILFKTWSAKVFPPILRDDSWSVQKIWT